jgi:hypothetical protein
MFVLGKVVQAIGVADVGYALYVGLTEPNSMGRELWLLCVGMGVFSVGRFIERRTSAQG